MPAGSVDQSPLPHPGLQVYRNTFRVVNDKGRTATTTHSFVTIPPEQAANGNVSVPEAVLSRSKAARLNQTLDAATRTVVRYLEASHRCRILAVQVDYLVDSESQLWLSWIGDATVAVGEAALDLSLAGMEPER